MTVTIQGYSTLTGSPNVILRVMQDARLFQQTPEDPDEYIKSVQQTVWRCYGISLNVTGSTIPERAESLLRELAKHDLVKIKE